MCFVPYQSVWYLIPIDMRDEFFKMTLAIAKARWDSEDCETHRTKFFEKFLWFKIDDVSSYGFDNPRRIDPQSQ